METNNTNEMRELEQMRSQLSILKEKLSKQEIINDRMLRNSMKASMSWINKYRWIALFCIPFVALCFLPMATQGQISWLLYGITIVVVAVSAIADWFINRLSDNMIMNGSMVEISQKLIKMKRIRRNQTIIGMSVVVLWLAWLLFDVYNHGIQGIAAGEPDMRIYYKGIMISIGVGAVIGAIIGLTIFFKMQRTNEQLLQQIKDIEETQ